MKPAPESRPCRPLSRRLLFRARLLRVGDATLPSIPARSHGRPQTPYPAATAPEQAPARPVLPPAPAAAAPPTRTMPPAPATPLVPAPRQQTPSPRGWEYRGPGRPSGSRVTGRSAATGVRSGPGSSRIPGSCISASCRTSTGSRPGSAPYSRCSSPAACADYSPARSGRYR